MISRKGPPTPDVAFAEIVKMKELKTVRGATPSLKSTNDLFGQTFVASESYILSLVESARF